MSNFDDDGDGHGGGAWKIALADLMTVLMVFFLVMWLSSIMDPGDRNALADSFKDQKAAKKEDAPANSPLLAQKGEVLINPLDLKPLAKSEIEQLVSGLDATVEETPEQFIITLKSDKAFESGRASLQENAKAKLEMVGERFANHRNRLTITGHTDNVPIRNVTYPSNWELSSARAASVARLFEDFGVDKQFMTVAGRADAEPVSANDTNIGRAQNRRIVISVDKNEVPPDNPKANKVKAKTVNKAAE